MAIHYSGGPVVHEQFNCTDPTTLRTGVLTALVDAGWTHSSTTPSELEFTFTGLPANGQQFILASGIGGHQQTYTFNTSVGGANSVHIGGDATACANNLAEAINAGSGSGTDYGTGTAQNPDFAASALAGVLTITFRASWNNYGINSGLSNVIPAGTSYLSAQTDSLLSGLTPQGLQFALNVILPTSADTYCQFQVASADQAISQTNYAVLDVSVGRTLEIIASPYQYWVFLAGAAGVAGTEMMAGVPWLRENAVPLVILDVTVASPIGIQTATPHLLTTGDHVFVDGVGGVAGVNGYSSVTVTGADTFTLDGSSGSGTYTSGTGLVASSAQIARAIWAISNTGIDNTGVNRGSLRGGLVPSGANTWLAVNQYSYGINATGFDFALLMPFMLSGDRPFMIPNWGNFYEMLEPILAWSATAYGGSYYVTGELWDAFVASVNVDKDQTLSGFNAHNWWQLADNWHDDGHNMRGSLWLATS